MRWSVVPRRLMARTWLICLLYVSVTVCGVSSEGLRTTVPLYSSCQHVLLSLGAKATDGEYPILLHGDQPFVAALYCSGFSQGLPKEYLSLTAGRSNNFASYYDNEGVEDACADRYPRKLYAQRGRTEYEKVRLQTDTLRVAIDDTKFSTSFGLNLARYGTAGDKVTSSPNCASHGAFSVDLTGTPFSIRRDVQWTWAGHYSNGSTNGVAAIQHSRYVGCYKDSPDRALPAYMKSSGEVRVDWCINYCRERQFTYAGLQYSSECSCGNSYDKHGPANEADCNMACAGERSQICGGNYRISVYVADYSQSRRGQCGGFPGECYPSLKSSPTTAALYIELVPTHPCTSNVCKNEGVCLATSATELRCVCILGYTGDRCQNLQESIVVNSSVCPAGLQAVQCSCVGIDCSGAEFRQGQCVAQSGHPQVSCDYLDPGHVFLYDVDSALTTAPFVVCSPGTVMLSCSYWDHSGTLKTKGQGLVDSRKKTCYLNKCQTATCKVQARCKAYSCGCENGGSCSWVTGHCSCPVSYFGEKCENFDICAYSEDQTKQNPCQNGGVCHSVAREEIQTYGGDYTGGSCLLPFTFQGEMFGQCITDNHVGPPYSCGGLFDGRDDYIDLGMWNPGPVHTLAVWIKPAITDNTTRAIVSEVTECQGVGLSIQDGLVSALYQSNNNNDKCSLTLHSLSALRLEVGKWYIVALTNSGNIINIFINGKPAGSAQTKPYAITNTDGLRIGGQKCCPGNNFAGLIKTVKIWNRALPIGEITDSMMSTGVQNSTYEALHSGLVGHWELGESLSPSCDGTTSVDHGGEDWILGNDEFVSGIHCNLTRFYIPVGVTVYVRSWNGREEGRLEVYAQDIHIEGFLDGSGAGYEGAMAPSAPGAPGIQGQSYSGSGTNLTTANRGGGGGGVGAEGETGSGGPGAGAGYGTEGGKPSLSDSRSSGVRGGTMYGDEALDILYLGSGGGSGGNAGYPPTSPLGGQGGSGGGAVRLYAQQSVVISGVVSVQGEKGQGDRLTIHRPTGCSGCPTDCDIKENGHCYGNRSDACWDMSGPGGGGSGGSIYITGQLVDIGINKLLAMGGQGGYGAGNCGGYGGVGRIRVDAVIYKGTLDQSFAIMKVNKLKNAFLDYSQVGQGQIDMNTTIYGDEVLRGCFLDQSGGRLFVYTIHLSEQELSHLTPRSCRNLCRKQGFRFSGTQYSTECYCDNHLDMDHKVSDSDCNMACKGDPRQLCGGSWRLTVYGPPPSSPAMGWNGVTQSCEPWCVTSNQDSPTPLWGQCSQSESQTWSIHCECPTGYRGDNCDQLCAEGKWGKSCHYNCNCSHTVTRCNSVTGRCICPPGYHGDVCQLTCPTDFYGEGCTERCACDDHSVCDHVTGNCKCAPGRMGTSCEFPCPSGKWGLNCTQDCVCVHGTCSPQDGHCSCALGYTGSRCTELCPPLQYGRDCELLCDCNSQPCDEVSGTCRCGRGYRGFKCQQKCPFGTYGLNCQQSCTCAHDSACDHVTGECLCASGWLGFQCDAPCPDKRFGEDCHQTCTCDWSNSSSCDPVTGQCLCKAGFMGIQCGEPCAVGFYGSFCNLTCLCADGAICDTVTGSCICGPGFHGDQCFDRCPLGTYGQYCRGVCSDNCTREFCDFTDGACLCPNGVCLCPSGYTGEDCSIICPRGSFGVNCSQTCSCAHGPCDHVTGICDCDPGWMGPVCNTLCTKGFFGKNCVNPCRCVNGLCNPVTGECSCIAGYGGLVCNESCPTGYYGPDCRLPCHSCGQYAVEGCDGLTGKCVCMPGYTGAYCDRPCPDGTWGLGCHNRSCQCSNGGTCNNVDGSCDCPYDFYGQHCEIKCPLRTWGFNCSKWCECGDHAADCFPATGVCICQPGFQGTQCSESCPSGYYGDQCSTGCECDLRHSVCDPIDGTCECHPGYTGHCDQDCEVGKYGKNCSQTCQCGGHGNCSHVNGACDCQPGYTGSHCDQECGKGKWGKHCSQGCTCNGSTCDHVTGVCHCPAGTKGDKCEQACAAGLYGYQCSELCGCRDGGACDGTTGECACQPGWFGRRCDLPCPGDHYGAGCSRSCPSCQNGASCHSVTGACVCTPGFIGTLCDQSCPWTSWGVGCSETCGGNCPAGCDPVAGDCFCSQGFCQHQGTCNPQGKCECLMGYIGDDCSVKVGPQVAPQSSTSSPPWNGSGLSKGAIAGVTVAALSIVLVIALVLVVWSRRRASLGLHRHGLAMDTSVNMVTADGGSTLVEYSRGNEGFSNPLYTAVS